MLESVLEVLSEPVLIVGKEGHILHANALFESAIGVAGVDNLSAFDIVAESRHDTLRELLAGEKDEGMLIFRREDENPLVAEVRAASGNFDGQPARALILRRDAAYLQRFKEIIMEKAPVGLVVCSPDGLVKEVSRVEPAMLRMDIHDPDYYIGYPALEGNPAVVRNGMLPTVRALLERGESFERDFSNFLTATDRRVALQMWGEPLMEDSLVIVHDLTIQKERGALLQALTEIAEGLLESGATAENLHDAIESLGSAAKLSRTFIFETVEVSDGDVVSRMIDEWVKEGVTPYKDLPIMQNVSLATCRWGEKLRANEVIYGEAGDFPEFEQLGHEMLDIAYIAIAPILVDGALYGTIGFIESEKRGTPPVVEVGVFRAAARMIGTALANERREGRLKALEESKSEIIRMISHDLRTPLNHARIAFNALCVDMGVVLEGKQLSLYKKVRDSMEEMEDLLIDLLSLEHAQRAPDWQRLSLDGLARDAAVSLELEIGAKGHEIQWDFDDCTLYVCGDSTQIRQAIINLLSNAIKYTPAGGRITLRMGQEKVKGQDGVWLSIEDTGIGIPDDALPHIFEPFYRVKQPGYEDIPGTGLGLPLVKTVIERHRGTVSVWSTPGVGSTFKIWLPIIKEPPESGNRSRTMSFM
jgi:signal transduction histidine kinase